MSSTQRNSSVPPPDSSPSPSSVHHRLDSTSNIPNVQQDLLDIDQNLPNVEQDSPDANGVSSQNGTCQHCLQPPSAPANSRGHVRTGSGQVVKVKVTVFHIICTKYSQSDSTKIMGSIADAMLIVGVIGWLVDIKLDPAVAIGRQLISFVCSQTKIKHIIFVI